MSSTGQIVGGLIGAVVGFFAGNPMLGASIGMAIGGAIDPPKGPNIEGPRLEDLTSQTATYGAVKPRAYGTISVFGNVFWIEGDKLKEVTTTEEQGGKGGGGATVTEYTYYATFAVGLCKGPISGIRRLWIGDKLIYSAATEADVIDSGGTLQDVIENTLAAAGVEEYTWKLYKGTDDQLPNARMQADKGIGNVSAYPGEAYLVFEDLNLGEWSNTLMRAQIKAEVVVSSPNIISDTAIATLPGFNESLGYGGYTWDLNRLVWSVNFDSTGVTIISWLRRNPDGYSVAIEFERQEFPYSKTVTRRDIGRYEMGGGAFQWYGNYIMCQSDEDLLISVQGHMAAPNDYILGFHGRDGSVWSPTAFTYAGFPGNSSFSVASKGRYFIGGNGRVFEVAPSGILQYSPAVGVYWMGISDNYLFTLSTNNTGYVTTTINKLSLVDLSIVATYSQTTYGSGSIEVIDDNSFYTIGKSSLGNYIYKWVDGNIISSALEGTTASMAAAKFSTFKETPHQFFYVPHFWEMDTNPGPSIHMVASSIDDSSAKLHDIIIAESALAELDTSDIDLTILTNSDIRGYKISAIASARSGFDTLQAAFPFDVYQSGYKVKFVSRGTSPITTILETELGASNTIGNEKSIPLLTIDRQMDSQLPYRVSILFLNRDREYDNDEQYVERLNVSSVNERRIEMALVLTPTEAIRAADILLRKEWTERVLFSGINLPPTRKNLEPTDIITIQHRGATYEARLISVEYRPDGSIEASAVATSAAAYTSTALGASSDIISPIIVPLQGLSESILLDIPMIDTAQNYPGMAAAIYGLATNWTGGYLFRSDDNGATYLNTMSNSNLPSIAIVTSTASIGRTDIIDVYNELSVQMLTSKVLYSVTFAEMTAGANLAAYGVDGRWEIISFQTIIDLGSGKYTLKTLVRGQFGTEWTMGLHQPNDYLVILSTSTIGFFNLPLAAINSPRLYRTVSANGSIDMANEYTDTYEAYNLKAFPACYINGYRSHPTFDWVINWTFISRRPVEAFSGIANTSYDLPETYDVVLYDSTYTTAFRTFSGLTSASCTYTYAEQLADIYDSDPGILYLDIFQNSATIGRGIPYRTSIQRDVWANGKFYQFSILSLDPIVYFKCDETSGNLVDSSLNSIVGTVTSTITYQQLGLLGSGYGTSILGSTGHISVPLTSDFIGKHTITLILKPTNLSTARCFFATGSNVNSGIAYLVASDGRIQMHYNVGGGDRYMQTHDVVFITNEKAHIAIYWDGSTKWFKVYKNGVLFPLDNMDVYNGSPNPPSSNPTFLSYTNGNYPFVGYADEMAYFNKELTQNDINLLYRASN